eukprot:Gb_16752 [translate_table: standard]
MILFSFWEPKLELPQGYRGGGDGFLVKLVFQDRRLAEIVLQAELKGFAPSFFILLRGFRGTVSWGSTGRSPPTTGNAWGAALSSSPPANAGPWSRSNVSSNRPSSGGSGTRPSTAGSDQSHDPATPNAWASASSRPSSASGALGLAHSQSTVTRPCSAESRPGSSQLSRFADSTVESGGAWGGSGTAQKLGETHPQRAHFTLTSVDFPTLGSDKNPDLRPQQGHASTVRSMPISEGLALSKERPQSSPPGWCEDASTASPIQQNKGTADTWKRESSSYPGEMPTSDEVQPLREDSQRQSYVNLPHTSDSWHCDDGRRPPPPSSMTEDEWRRGGPPIGPYGPSGGPGRFPFNPTGYMRPFEFGPVPYAQGPSGPAGYTRHGEMYGPFMAPPAIVPGRPGIPMGHSMYPSQLPYDGYYGPPGVAGARYGGVDERDIAMMRMGGGPGVYGSFPHNQGRHPDVARFRHGGPGSGPRPASFHSAMSREHNDPSSYNGVACEGAEKAFPKHSDGWLPKDADISRDSNHPFLSPDSNLQRNSVVPASNPQNESSNTQGASTGHRDWGAAESSDEPMDFSKPVFDEEVLSSRVFANSPAIGSDPCIEKGAKITRAADETCFGVKSRDSGDSSKSAAPDNPIKVTKGNSMDFDRGKAAQSEEHFKGGQEISREAVGLPVDEKNDVAKSIGDKIQGEDVEINASLRFGNRGAPTQKSEAYTKDRNNVSRAQGQVTSFKTVEHQGHADAPNRVSISSASSLERNSGLSTTAKLKGGLSSATGINNAPYETPKNKDKVQLLKRSDYQPADNMLGAEEAIEKTQNTQEAKGTQELLGRKGHRMKGRINVQEGDWRRKVSSTEPAVRIAKGNLTTSRQSGAFSVPGAGITGPENISDKADGDSQAQQSPDSHDYEAQRARMKEIAAQRAKQLQREEEERTKEQKAKALAKLEELDRRSLGAATSQDAGHAKVEDTAKLNNESEVLPEAVQEQLAVDCGSQSYVPKNNAIDNLENTGGNTLGHHEEIDKGDCENDKRIGNVSREDQISQPNMGEQKDLLTAGDNDSNKSTVCEAHATPVSRFAVSPVNEIDSNGLVNSGKNDKVKRENYRRISNVSREDQRNQMKMEEQKDLVKERGSPPRNNAVHEVPVLPVPPTQVSPSTWASESMRKDTPVPVSVSSESTDQLQQASFPKQTRMRPKGKQYVPQQKSSSLQPSTLEKTEQLLEPSGGHYAKLVGVDDGVIVSSNAAVEKSVLNASSSSASNANASGSDGAPIFRKKKNRNIKTKHKIDRPVVNSDSVGSAEHDPSQLSSIAEGSIHLTEEVNGNFVKPPGSSDTKKVVNMSNGKNSELASIESGGNDVTAVHSDTPALDRGLSQSTDDSSAGRMPQLKSQLSKRLHKGSQDVRVLEKTQGNEGMVWAPVRPVNHNCIGGDNQKLDQSGAEVQPSRDRNNELAMQNPVRNRRAEMERYVPKPVAKEQAQHQENSQPPAGASVSVQVQTDHSNIQQGTSQNLHTGEMRQQHSFVVGNKGNIVGHKHGKPNVSWRQRNSSEISETNKGTHVHQSSEGGSVSSGQINEFTVFKPRLDLVQTKHFKSEGVDISPQSEQPTMPKSTAAPTNRQQSHQSEPDQSSQPSNVPPLQTSIAAKEHDLQLASKREQNTHDRFYQANKSRSKSNKFSVRQGNMEGNSQSSKLEVNDESEKIHSTEQINPHQRPKSSGSWTPRQQGPTDDKGHPLHQQPMSVGQTDVVQGMIGSHEEHRKFHGQSAQQTRLPSTQYAKPVTHRQEAPDSSAKQQHVHDRPSWQQPDPLNQPEGKNQGSHSDVKLQTNHLPQQQLKSSHVDRQQAEKDQQKQTTNSASYQQRHRSAGQSHWQQTGPNSSGDVARRTGSHEEHYHPTTLHGRKQQGPPIPRSLESSHGAGQYQRQDFNKQQAPINNDLKKLNSQMQSQSISHQKPQEFYQPKSGLASGQGYKHEISHSTASHSSSAWAGEHRSSQTYRDRDQSHARRGRSGGRSGGGSVARGSEAESKSEHSSKQRLVINATGGAIPNQVAG